MDAENSDTPRQLAEPVRELFWDCDPDALDWVRNRRFVVERVLSRGSWAVQCWLREELGDPCIRDVLMESKGLALSRAQLRLWELLLDIPAELVTDWLDDPRRTLWDCRSR